MRLPLLAMQLILPTFLSAAPSGDLVRAALESAAHAHAAGQNFEALIGRMTVPQKTEARGLLDALDRRSLDAAQTRELAQAYQLLEGNTAATPGASLARAAARALEDKKFGEATALARQALKAEPSNREALAVLHFAEGRSSALPETTLSGKAPAPETTPPGGPSPESALPASNLPRSLQIKTAPPPSATRPRPLDPKAPDYWDRQLLAPLLKHSDANAVAREYLSPLLKANKVTLRLERVTTNPDLNGTWGYLDGDTSVIHYNLDAINEDIREYAAFYAKTAPSRRVRPITPSVPLDPAQIEYVTGRFLPLAVHEAGGHGTHTADLKQRLGAIGPPMNKDTEIMAWRLEAAAIALERRHDPHYLTEPTQFAKEENGWLAQWRFSRHADDPSLIVRYLDSMGDYESLVQIGEDPELIRKRYSESVALVQSNCRRHYDVGCGAAITCLAALFPPTERAYIEKARGHLDLHSDDDASRAAIMNVLSQMSIVRDRLDPKGITVVSGYYKEQDKRVQRLEALADPLTIWQKLKSTWHE